MVKKITMMQQRSNKQRSAVDRDVVWQISKFSQSINVSNVSRLGTVCL